MRGLEVSRSVFTTKDGVQIKVQVFHADKDVWIRLVAFGTGAAREEADRLNLRLSGWSYQIGAWKERTLVPTMADLKAREPAPAATPGAAAPEAAAPGAAAPEAAAPK
jgi:hypothetical protein